MQIVQDTVLVVGRTDRAHIEVKKFYNDPADPLHTGAQVILLDKNDVVMAVAMVGVHTEDGEEFWRVGDMDAYQRNVKKDDFMPFLKTEKFTKAFDAAMKA